MFIPNSIKHLGVQVQVEAISEVIDQLKKIDAMPDALLGAEKLAMLIDTRSRLLTLMETLDWSTLATMVDVESIKYNEAS